MSVMKMKNVPLKIIIVAILGSTPLFSFSQLNLTVSSTLNYVCNGVDCSYNGPTILINEIQISPMVGDGAIFGTNIGGLGKCGEWIELYNPHKCQSVDISHYYLGNATIIGDLVYNCDGGGYLIPAGTIVPPRGFCLIRGADAPKVPSSLLVKNGGNTVELVITNADNTCIGKEERRLWFPNTGSWFAFYDRDGVPQDAVYWGSNFNLEFIQSMYCLDAHPCTPLGGSFSGNLSHCKSMSSERKAYIYNTSVEGEITNSDNTIRRIPDGGDWRKNEKATATMGTCNSTCESFPVITCNGTATVSVNGGTPPYTYLWSDSQAQSVATAKGLCAGTYTVKVTDNSSPTPQTATMTVKVDNHLPSLTLPSHAPVCVDEPAFAWQGLSPAAGVLTGTGVSGVTFNPATAGVGTHQLTYAYTDANGCYNAVKTSITVNPVPVLTQPEDIVICSGKTVPEISFSGINMDTVQWEVISGSGVAIGMVANSGKGNIPSFVAVNNGITPDIVSIKATPKSAAGCVGASKTFTVTVNPLPVLNKVKDVLLCVGDNCPAIFFYGTNIDTYTWRVTEGSGIDMGMRANSGNKEIPSFTAVNTGSTDVSATISIVPKTVAGCIGDTVKFKIRVYPYPVLQTPDNITLCAGDTFSFNSFKGTHFNTLNWAVTTGSGTAIGMAENGMDSIPAFVAVNTGSTPVTVTITVTPKSPAGCTGKPQIFTIKVNPLPVLNPISDIALCTGETVSSIIFTGTNIISDIRWDAPEGIAIGMPLSSGTGNIPAFKAINSDTTDISVTVGVTPKSAAGCVGKTETFTITVYHKVDIGVYLGNDTTICHGVRHLLDATHPEADSYEWYDQSKEAIYTVSNQEGKIWVIVRGQCNEFRDTINIRLYKNPTVNLGKDLTYCEDEVIYRVLDVTTPNATSYVWQDGSTLPTYIVEAPGIYRVTVSNICVSVSDTVEVKIKDCSVLEIWLPNAFTPDGDGLNDVFKPAVKTPEFLKEYEMTIYDRWGQLMFITQDYLSGWRGKDHKNRDCSEGVYTGIIRYKNSENQEFIKKFSITLLR